MDFPIIPKPYPSQGESVSIDPYLECSKPDFYRSVMSMEHLNAYAMGESAQRGYPVESWLTRGLCHLKMTSDIVILEVGLDASNVEITETVMESATSLFKAIGLVGWWKVGSAYERKCAGQLFRYLKGERLAFSVGCPLLPSLKSSIGCSTLF